VHPWRGPEVLFDLSALTPDSVAVAQVIRVDAMCVSCIRRKTGLTLDAVLAAFRVLEAGVALLRRWGRCPVCLRKTRAVVRLG
jgi:hypothetical protein